MLPHNHEEILERAFSNSKRLIQLGYWTDVDEASLTRWFNNFIDTEEKFIAAIIISNIIFRNRKTIKNFASNLFHIDLPEILENKYQFPVRSIENFEKSLTDQKYLNSMPLRFATIEEDVDDHPAHSGQSIYRIIQRKNFFHKKFGVTIKKLKEKIIHQAEHVKLIVILDDLSGSGDQFTEFYQNNQLYDLNIDFLYCPIAAHESSINRIKSLPNAEILPGEILNNDHALFNEYSLLIDCKENAERYKVKYLEIIRRIKGKSFPLGKGSKELTYCLEDSIPNNNVSLIWLDQENWHPLFRR